MPYGIESEQREEIEARCDDLGQIDLGAREHHVQHLVFALWQVRKVVQGWVNPGWGVERDEPRQVVVHCPCPSHRHECRRTLPCRARVPVHGLQLCEGEVVEFGKGVEIPLKQPPVHDVVHDVIDDGFSQNVEEVTSPGLLPPLLGFCSFLCPFSGCRGKVP